ncbi:MAG: MFS transporter, partial [Polyangiales bacterium]
MRSPLFAIFLVVLIDVIGLTFILPLLPFYAEHFGASPREVGLLVATFAAFQLVSGPVLGGLSDRYGRRRLLVVSQLGTIAGYVLLGLANSLAGVFFARVIHGAMAGNLSLAQAYIADVTKPEDRARAFAFIGVAFGIGFLLGPAVSGWLAHKNIHYPVFAAGGLTTLSMLTTLALVKEPPREAEPGAPPYRTAAPAEGTGRRLGLLEWGTYVGYFKREALRGPLLQFFSFAFSFAMFTSGFALFAERRFHWGPREVGYLFAYAGLLGIVLQGGVVAALVKR